MHLILGPGVLFFTVFIVISGVASQDCEVCVGTINKFYNFLPKEAKDDQHAIKKEFKKFCTSFSKTSKENRFCYYLGGLPESATSTLAELSRQLSFKKPADKICQDLKKTNVQICELRYDKEIDWNTVNLKKLKVRDLRKILSDWNEECDGCIEKSDYINRIEQLKKKYVKTEL